MEYSPVHFPAPTDRCEGEHVEGAAAADAVGTPGAITSIDIKTTVADRLATDFFIGTFLAHQLLLPSTYCRH
jgi:hypothetical protein